MASKSPGGSIADHTGRDAGPTPEEVNCLLFRDDSAQCRDDPPPWSRLRRSMPLTTDGGTLAAGAHRTPYPQHHRSSPLKEEIVP
jgi:hypothetical protein